MTSPSQASTATHMPGDNQPSDCHANMSLDARESDEFLISTTEKSRTRGRYLPSKVFVVTCAILCLIIASQSLYLFRLHQQVTLCTPAFSRIGREVAQDQTRLIGLPNGFWNGSSLHPQNSVWDRIDGGGHGIVAFPPQFVLEHHLPETIAHPNDPSKRVYALEAYHMIHCLERIRKDYLALYRGEEPGKPLEHDLHCFDAIRQSIMCHASDELLIITGQGHARGYNQTVQCRSWDDLRDFATEHTACYNDEPPAWDKCDDGSDGLPTDSLLG